MTRLIYHSNKIEGTTLTKGETHAILFDQYAKVHASAREFWDVVNHKQAFDYVMDTIEEPLSEKIIKNIGIIINKNIDEIEGYRKSGVVIVGSEHTPPPATEIPNLMMQIVHQYNEFVKEESVSIFLREAWFHIKFEKVHPFSDGNGRTGRLLILRGLLKSNMPPFCVNSDNRAEYIDAVSGYTQEKLSEMIRLGCQKEMKRIEGLVQQ